MTLPTALEVSCDTWFYRLGDLVYRHDPRAQGTLIQNWARKLGLGHAPPVDLTGATSGYLPGPGRIFERRFGFPWTEGQTINLAIGQGALQVSPLQLAVAYSALINGGKVVRPHVGEAMIRDGVHHRFHYKPVRTLKLSPYTWAIRQGLYEAANSPGGTSQRSSRVPDQGRRQDGNRRAGPGQLVVRVVGAVQQPQARRRRERRARRLRRRGGRPDREEDLRGVPPPEGLARTPTTRD